MLALCVPAGYIPGMDWKAWYLSKSDAARAVYAERAGTSTAYIEIHLLASPNRRKTPKPALMKRLAEASEGEITLEHVLAHFYGIPKQTTSRVAC